MYAIEVFKAGTHTAMNGTTRTYTVEDLKSIAKLYNGQSEHKAPLVLGHPQLDSPAYGWVDHLAVVGQKLVAMVDQVQEKLKDAVKFGMFKKVSIALFANDLLRHVGLLGAAPPAVQGLAPVQFAKDQEFTEYAWATDEWRIPKVGALLRNIREFFIGKFSLEEANTVLPSAMIDNLIDAAPSTFIPEAPKEESFAAPTQPKEEETMEMKELEAKFAQMETAFAALKDENSGLKETVATLQHEGRLRDKKYAQNLAATEFGGFIDGLIRDGKVLPAERDALVSEFADTYMANSQLQYAEGETDLVTKFKDRLSARPVSVKPQVRQFATGERAKAAPTVCKVASEFAAVAEKIQPESLDLDQQIQAYADKNGITYEQAAAAFGAGADE